MPLDVGKAHRTAKTQCINTIGSNTWKIWHSQCYLSSISHWIQPSKSRNTLNNVNIKLAASHDNNFKIDFGLF